MKHCGLPSWGHINYPLGFPAKIFVIAFLELDILRESIDVNDEYKMYFTLDLVPSGGFRVY